MRAPMESLNIPGFELIEKIGQGGMAVVWKARQMSLDRIVAIKFLQPQLAGDTNEVDRLLTEARSAAKLKHVGIVQVYDANLSDGVPYVIMEYIAGYNVGDWVRRKGALDERDALLVAECVATALNHAWTLAGIIHCDIKPDNIMVDRDGTIKVADLGLARSIGPRSARAASEEIMGTPSYISPEQSSGEQALDCRTDIYSLGATLYQLITGRRLFEQYPDRDAMDRQMTDQEPDPLDLNPAISQGLAWLIEKMLAKKREDRQPDWHAVLKDIESVQAGRMPISPLLGEGQKSTIKRSPRRQIPARRPAQRLRKTTPGGALGAPEAESSTGFGRMLLFLILLLAAAALAFWMWRDGKPRRQPPPVPVETPRRTTVTPPSPSNTVPAAAQEEHGKDLYAYVREYAAANPREFAEIIQKYRKVAAEAKGTRYALMADEEARKTEAEWRRAITTTLASEREKMDQLCRAGRWREAAEQWERYAGEWARETADTRRNQAREWRAQAERIEADAKIRQAQVDARFDQWIVELARSVVTGASVQAVSNIWSARENWPSRRSELNDLQKYLGALGDSDGLVLESYRPLIGQTIGVTRMKGDKVTFALQRVEAKTLYGEQVFANGARIGLSIPVSEIALADKWQRLGGEETPDVCLIKGAWACQAAQFGRAVELFQKIPAPLGPTLVRLAAEAETRRGEENASVAAFRILKPLGISASELDDAAGSAIRALDEARWQEGSRQLAKYQETHGHTAAGRQFVALWDAARQARAAAASAATAPAVPQLDENIPTSSEPVDLERVRKSLLDRNPGLDAENIQMEPDSQGRMRRVVIRSAEIQDAGSLENCDSIQDLTLSPADDQDAWYRGKIAGLRSLTPLRKMPLKKLNVAYTLIDDLKPLANNNRLTILNLRNTGVSDLGPLLNCPLEDLIISGTEVKSIAPLRGKNLRRLEMAGIKVNDLSPISGKALMVLDVGQTGVRDLSPLRGMPLVRLNLADISAYDFAILKSLMQVQELDVSGTQFKDLAFCRQMPLRSLRLARTKIADLNVLREMDLKYLDISDTPVKDLEPLRGMLLERLDLSGSKVVLLTPLQKMQLRHLNLSRTAVRALDPVLGQSIEGLNLSQTEIPDLSGLKKMPLRYLHFNPKTVRDYEFLRRHPTLKEVWLDGGDPPQSMNNVLNSIPYLQSVNGNKFRH